MKIRFLAIIVLMVAGLSLVKAQGAAEYRLREVGAAEYLKIVPIAIDQYWEDLPKYYGKIPHQPVLSAILLELESFGKEQVFSQSFDLLGKAYESITNGRAVRLLHSPLDYDWDIALVKAWLRENRVDFEQTPLPDIPGISAKLLQSVDFDGDGQSEYVLDFSTGNRRTFLVLKKDESQLEHYQVIVPPIGWQDAENANYAPELFSISFQDITLDSSPEWTVASVSGGSGMWIHTGHYQILTWRNNQLVDILRSDGLWEFAGGGMQPIQANIEYRNVDADVALEVTIKQEQGDPWDCRWVETSVYDWNGTSLAPKNTFKTYQDSADCLMRRAEGLMWNNLFAIAIPLYERALELGWHSDNPEFNAEIRQYARIRLVLANQFIGETEQAETILAELQGELPASELMRQLIVVYPQFNGVTITHAARLTGRS